MCLVDDDLVGNHQSNEGLASSPQDPMMGSNPLSLYASFLAFQEQHPESRYDQLIVSALRNRADAKLTDKKEESTPFLSLSEPAYTVREARVSDNEPAP